MVRTSSLSSDIFLDLLDCNNLSQDIHQFINNKDLGNYLEESFLVSSKSLYSTLNKTDLDDKKRNYKYSLLKYITRASTRPTPYGMFASVALKKIIIQECTQNDCRVPSRDYPHRSCGTRMNADSVQIMC